MGNGMDRILPGLYVGSLKDSKDREQIERNQITHVISIHDAATDGSFKDVKYFCIKLSDHANENIQQHFPECIEFIHRARLDGGNCLVHCLAGISRSVTIAIAYVMTVTELSWVDAINAVRGARKQANPNFGFQRQLQNYEHTQVKTEKSKLADKFGELPKDDHDHCRTLLEAYFTRQKELFGSIDTKNNNNNNNIHELGFRNIYPLPFNAYGVDNPNNSVFRTTKTISTASSTTTSESSSSSSSSSSSANNSNTSNIDKNLSNINLNETKQDDNSLLNEINKFFT